LREITLKEAVVDSDGVVLWPRSTNPKWNEPLPLTFGEDDADMEVRITGILVAVIRRF
jgi:hypothetical protein